MPLFCWRKRKPAEPLISNDIRDMIEKRHSHVIAGTIGEAESDLVVDDNQVNRNVLLQYLSKYKYPTIQASNGIEALAKTVDRNYTIIWVDLKMPLLGGIETAKYLRAEYPKGFGYKGFIVAVTGFVDDESRDLCLEVGINAVLSKPYVGDNIYRLHHHPFFSEKA
jgi:CheY-like chemotaxis protein